MKRSKFSLSHFKLLTGDMGQLLPIGLIEVLPGDTFQQSTSALLRCSPLLTPVMHPVDVRIHHWYVPNRLVWDDWEDFITGGPDGTNASTFPYITITPAEKDLADYLGLPVGTEINVSALPFRMYAKIFNEYYRDQDLQTALTIDTTDGQDTTTNTALQNCGWEKDYFTSARPTEQKGPSISIPLGTSAPVVTDQAVNTTPLSIYSNTEGSYRALRVNASDVRYETATGTAANSLYADLSTASAANVNLLREAFALQRFEEARSRYGSRYTEYLAYLGVHSGDARLQRPEYLGGGRNTIQFSEVLSSNGATGGNLAQLGGHGISALRSNRYRRHFTEHGYVLSLMSIRPKTMYIDGVPRHWSRQTKEDYWQKELQHIGQQEVRAEEVYAAAADPDAVFGYQDRYDEYRRHESWISGEFRGSLDTWHFARAFASEPSLNASFVKCVPSETPFASSAENVLWIEVKHSVQARRLVARTGTSFIF